jgi:RNA polymerase sigma factor (sigma-70 family)
MDQHAKIGGLQSRFPLTRHSVVAAVRSADPEVRARAVEVLVTAYWKPVYKYVRLRWRAPEEDAEDLTQGFFTEALTQGFFERYDPARAKFRTYLRTCLHGFVANERKASRRLKRGGGAPLLSLDFASAEGELQRQAVRDDADMDEYFHRECVRSLFAFAVDVLRERCERSGKELHFSLFRRYDLEGSDGARRRTYAELAEEFDVSAVQVTNHLAAVRREFRKIVLERMRELSGSEAEFRAEARELLGVSAP